MEGKQPFSVSRTVMGSPFTILAYDGGKRPCGERVIAAAVETAYSELSRVEDLLTDFRDSPLSRINAGAGGPPVRVPEELFDLLEFALGLCRDSSGAFDVTYAAVGELWRAAFKNGVPPSDSEIDSALVFVDHKAVEMNRRDFSVRLPVKGMRVGLGSIGKGYGVDRAYRTLRDCGLENFLVNGAGDIRVFSAADAPRPWRIAIRNPFSVEEKPAGVIALRRGAVVTSGDYERFFIHGGKKYHHIIDARTGRVRSDTASVTVCAATAALANAYSISAMALGPEEGAAFLRRRRDAAGVIITAAGTVMKCGAGPEFRNIQGKDEGAEVPEEKV